MGFAFRRKESIDEAARRVAGRQLEKAVDELGTADAETLPATVHGVRKRTKRVRAVARLVRSGIGKRYGRVNEAARDAAAELSAVRDAAALLGTFDALVVASDPDQLTDGLVLVRRGLVARADATAAVDVDRAVELLTQARGAVGDWAFDDGLEVLATGLDVTYRRGRTALRAAVDDPTPEAFHEWRKAAKHLWYQIQLLHDAAPSVLCLVYTSDAADE